MGQHGEPIWSLNTRLVLALLLATIAFLGLAGWVIDRAFTESAVAAIEERLQAHLYTLIAIAEPGDDATLIFPDVLPEPRFNRPGSGLYALAWSESFFWQSPSTLGTLSPPRMEGVEPGEILFAQLGSADQRYFSAALQVLWESPDAQAQAFHFNVTESDAAFVAERSTFRRTLWVGLGLVTGLLALLQWGLLRWGLRPLRRLSKELEAVEAGNQPLLSGDYPRELTGLTVGLNSFIQGERANLERQRNSLSDLAHSLKTPLAVVRAGLPEESSAQADGLATQLDRMDEIIAYQLRRAGARARLTFGAPQPVAPLLESLITTLEKMHPERPVDITLDASDEALFYGEKGDFMEVAGNLLENAFKWSQAKIAVRADSSGPQGQVRRGVTLTVADDGPGVPEAARAEVLQRWVRADERTPGHGIGLAMVGEIVDAYGGTIVVSESEALGGAEFTVQFPGKGEVR